MYICVCSLFLIHGHSFEQICTKFGLWRPYTLQMVIGRVLASAARAHMHELRTHLYTVANVWRALSDNSELVASSRNRSSEV